VGNSRNLCGAVECGGSADRGVIGEFTANRKGCDIGYALAVGSCAEINGVESRTVTAPDATTAFAVPNPNSLSRRLSVFSGLVARRVASSG